MDGCTVSVLPRTRFATASKPLRAKNDESLELRHLYIIIVHYVINVSALIVIICNVGPTVIRVMTNTWN